MTNVKFFSIFLDRAVVLKGWSPTSSISITCKLIKSADSWPHRRSAESEALGVGPSSLCISKSSR